MNILNKFFLTLVLLPRKLYSQWGINTSHLTAILSTKLIMDDRRSNTMQATRQNRNSGKEISIATQTDLSPSITQLCLYRIFPNSIF